MKDDTKLRELAQPLLSKWSIFIILMLEKHGELHFAGLERNISGISRKVLTDHLKQLENSSIIYKKGISSTGHKTHYGLTSLGQSLIPLLLEIKDWLKNNKEQLKANK
jgi:DNA-binding HxlR family transcriptional regulator